MKSLITISFFLTLASMCFGQNLNPQLDTTLARQLGADQYGMKMYVLVILKSGENKTKNAQFIDSCFTGHMSNIGKLVESKQLIVAGPFGKNMNDYRGLFILNVSTNEDALKLLESDPAIKEKLLKAELYPWYGSAALSEYLNVHDKIWEEKP